MDFDFELIENSEHRQLAEKVTQAFDLEKGINETEARIKEVVKPNLNKLVKQHKILLDLQLTTDKLPNADEIVSSLQRKIGELVTESLGTLEAELQEWKDEESTLRSHINNLKAELRKTLKALEAQDCRLPIEVSYFD